MHVALLGPYAYLLSLAVYDSTTPPPTKLALHTLSSQVLDMKELSTTPVRR